jgi:hypothetical protein
MFKIRLMSPAVGIFISVRKRMKETNDKIKRKLFSIEYSQSETSSYGSQMFTIFENRIKKSILFFCCQH